MFHVPNQFRLRQGFMATDESNGNNGVFLLPLDKSALGPLRVIASVGALAPGELAWEHVSVSLPHRTPTWDEMCAVKALFWDEEDCVVQFHPPRRAYVNFHAHCLHLWRPVGVELPQPNPLMVGPLAAPDPHHG